MKTKTHARRANMLAACALLILLTGSHTAHAAKDTSFVAHYTTASLSAQEQKAGNLVNSDRSAYNLPPLVLDPELSRIARIKSQDMRDNQYFSHTSPTYGDVRSMLKQFGYSFSAAGENIAHHATIEKSQAAFLSSPGHRKNIMSSTYTKMGIGVALDSRGFVYLTQIFCR